MELMSSDETRVIAITCSSASEAAPASSTLREELKAAVEALQAALGDRLVGVVLYGSRARGEGTEDSDWDLLVIAEDLPAKAFDRYLYFKRVLPATRFAPVSVLAKTPQQFAEGVSSLHLDMSTPNRNVRSPAK
jgi:predicted nucleotidyltransferase